MASKLGLRCELGLRCGAPHPEGGGGHWKAHIIKALSNWHINSIFIQLLLSYCVCDREEHHLMFKLPLFDATFTCSYYSQDTYLAS
jgi:hypothetical protein